jgi:general secretion pathway protein G
MEITSVRPGYEVWRPNREKAQTKTTKAIVALVLLVSAGLLVVITIIGLLMSLVGPRVLNYLSESKVKAATIQIQSFASSLDLFYLDLGRYPSTTEGLAALVRRPGGETGWNGPYLQKGYVPNDPWGHPYIYRSPGENGRPYDISSLGSSGREGGTGTAVAIKSWERR